MAGPEPMKLASREPPSSAFTSSPPALKVCVVSLVLPSSLLKEPLLHADDRGGVGDVREVAEPQLGGGGAGGRRAARRRAAGVAASRREHADRRARRGGRGSGRERGAGAWGAVHAWGSCGVPGRRAGPAGAARSGARGARARPRAERSATELVEGVPAPRRPEPLEVGGRVAGRRAGTPTATVWALQRAASYARHHRARLERERQPGVRDAGSGQNVRTSGFRARHLRRGPAAGRR